MGKREHLGTDDGELPPRLSDQRKFVLAWLTEYSGGSSSVHLSWAIAEKFGGLIYRQASLADTMPCFAAD